MATPHNQASIGEIAKTVLFPGDPLRAKYIAETFLENPVQFNAVRNMFGYTGTYKGHKVSVMGSGMGMGSLGIYAYELFTAYGVENIIRVGSSGAYKEELNVYDTVLATSAFSESTFTKAYEGVELHETFPSESLNEKLVKAAERLNIPLFQGCIHSSDLFYHKNDSYMEEVNAHNCLAVEMESFALFHLAKDLGKNASCLITISDSLVTHQETTAEERESSFKNMMLIALEAIDE